jgi:hypothetical protein
VLFEPARISPRGKVLGQNQKAASPFSKAKHTVDSIHSRARHFLHARVGKESALETLHESSSRFESYDTPFGNRISRARWRPDMTGKSQASKSKNMVVDEAVLSYLRPVVIQRDAGSRIELAQVFVWEVVADGIACRDPLPPPPAQIFTGNPSSIDQIMPSRCCSRVYPMKTMPRQQRRQGSKLNRLSVGTRKQATADMTVRRPWSLRLQHLIPWVVIHRAVLPNERSSPTSRALC